MAPVVAGSIPVSHPKSFNHLQPAEISGNQLIVELAKGIARAATFRLASRNPSPMASP